MARDYRDEYRRRLERERERAAREGRPFSRSRARGHGEASDDNTRRRVRRLYLNLSKQYGKEYPGWDQVKASASNFSWQQVEDTLRRQESATRAYRAGDPTQGRANYATGTATSYPIQFFWYHGT